jgi:hypothetical protein
MMVLPPNVISRETSILNMSSFRYPSGGSSLTKRYEASACSTTHGWPMHRSSPETSESVLGGVFSADEVPWYPDGRSRSGTAPVVRAG